MMDGEEGTTKYAKGAKREVKLQPNPDEPEPNSKSEARNSKQILMFKRIMIKTGLAAI